MTIRCHIKLIWGMIIFRPWLALPELPRLRLPSLFAIREAVEHLSPAKIKMNEQGNIKNRMLKTSTLDTLMPQGSVASSSCMRIFWRGWKSNLSKNGCKICMRILKRSDIKIRPKKAHLSSALSVRQNLLQGFRSQYVPFKFFLLGGKSVSNNPLSDIKIHHLFMISCHRKIVC